MAKPRALIRNVYPKINLQPCLRQSLPGNFDCGERKRHPMHRLRPDFQRGRKIGEVGMKLLDAQRVLEARPGGAADRIGLGKNFP